MATSKFTLIALAVTFAVLAATLQPSTAAPDQQGGGSSRPSAWRPHRPLPPLPCIPGLPWLPACSNNGSSSPSPTPPAADPPEPAECRTSLSGLAPCADFLTNSTRGVHAPAPACCDGFTSLVKDAPICLCHAVNGDLGKLLPAPVLRLRVMALPRACRAAMPLGTLRKCIRGPVPPMDAAPSAPPAA